MTTEDFFAANGPTEFIDRLAAVLGIPSYRIRVVDIRSGSTIVDFALTGNENLASNPASSPNYTNAQQEELVKINTLLLTMAQNGSLVLNAPILSIVTTTNFTTAQSPTISYPTVITPNVTNPASDGSPIIVGTDRGTDLDWWVYLLIGVGCLVAVGVLITVGIVLRLFYRKIYGSIEVVSVDISQSMKDFQKVEPEKPVEVHDLLQETPTTQLYAEARSSKPTQPPRAARW